MIIEQHYKITPYVGVNNIQFGMAIADVVDTIGKPKNIIKSRFSNATRALYKEMSVMYSPDENIVAEVTFLPSATVFYKEINIFSDEKAIEKLIRYDNSPVISTDTIIFYGLGLALCGFDPLDNEIKALIVFKKGYWDQFRSNAKPYKKK